MNFLRCIGEAVVAQGMRGLMGFVPMGEKVYDVAANAIERYRVAKRQDQIVSDAEEAVRAGIAEVRSEAHKIAIEVGDGLSAEEILQLESYLMQVPGVARQSLKCPTDPTGKSIPKGIDLLDPVQLASLLPRRAPQFRGGDTVPHAPQWEFVELLGAGGFGEVWLARHTFLGQLRAFKFCLDPESRDRLLRHEGEVVQRVMRASQTVGDTEHGIVPLMDAFLEGDAPWLAYEFIDGGDLSSLARELFDQTAPKRAATAVRVLIDLAAVVGRFHTLPHPIVHRDLKPANVLVKRVDSRTWLLRVTDFGIGAVSADRGMRQATSSTPSLSLGESFRGSHTPTYASPQQKKGHKADVRDDVHALGIIGYQLLLGDLSAERPAGKWRKKLVLCELPDATLDLLESCWDDDPDERPKDAAALAQNLRDTLKPPDQARSSGNLPRDSRPPATPPELPAERPSEARMRQSQSGSGGRIPRPDATRDRDERDRREHAPDPRGRGERGERDDRDRRDERPRRRRFASDSVRSVSRGGLERTFHEMPMVLLALFTSCCVPWGVMVTACIWAVARDPETRKRAKTATLIPLGVFVGYLMLVSVMMSLGRFPMR